MIIEGDTDSFNMQLLYLILAALANAVFSSLRGMLFSFAIARFKLRMRELLFRCLMSQEIAFFDAERTGELTSRIAADTTKVWQVLIIWAPPPKNKFHHSQLTTGKKRFSNEM